MEEIKIKNVLLVDESFNFDEINKFLDDTINIITFDILSHNILDKKKIKHTISDSFLIKNDYNEIQKKSYELEQWYNSKELQSSLLFDGINLGQLVYFDSVNPITKFLKFFFEISKIYKKFPEINFITTKYISKILECFTNSFQLLDEKSIPHQKDIHYDYKIGSLNLGLNISLKNYKKFKKLSERFFSTLFTPKNIPNEQKSVLLVEFNPVKFSNLLLESKSSSISFILYNNRKPSVWNKNSFDVLKKSGTKIISQNLITNSKIIEECEKKFVYYEKSIFDLFNKKVTSDFFQFMGFNLWPIAKNMLINLILNKLKQLIFEILSTRTIFDIYKIDSIIINTENGSTENIVMNMAKSKNIPIILMQHGLIYDSEDLTLRNNLTGIYPNNSDYAIVWGPLMKNHLISLGYKKEKIKDLGCTIYDNMTKKFPKQNNTILIATSPPMGDFAIDLSVKTNQNYEKIIKEICLYCKENNLDLIFKLHPSLEDNIHEIIKQNNSQAEIVSSGDIIPLIEKSSLLITFDLSTTILESQLLSTPVFSISYREHNNLNSEIFKNTCPRVPIDNFKDIIQNALFDEKFRYKLMKNGTDYSNSYLSQQKNSVNSILNFLENI